VNAAPLGGGTGGADDYFDPAGVKLLGLIWQWRRFLIVNMLIVAVLAAGVSLLMPNVYRAGATILPPTGEVHGISSQLIEALGSMGPVGFATSVMQPSNSDLLATVLRSRRLADRIIASQDLVSYYEVETVPKARRVLVAALSITVDADGLVQIRCTDKNPAKAAAIVEAALAALDSINLSLSNGAAAATRRFVESRLTTVEGELQRAEDDLRRFQQQTGSIALEEQLKVLVQGLALMRVDRMKQEMQLSLLEEQLGSDHRRVQALRERIAGIDRQIEAAEASSDSAATLTTGNAPDLALKSLRLIRQVTVYDQIYQFLKQAAEQAKIDEMRNTPTFTILDPAEPPDLKWKPKRSLIVLGSAAVVFLLLLLWIVWTEATRVERSAAGMGYGEGWRRLARRAR
jgi:tyrosine-protein kinase Etk/Wzc